MDLTAKLKERAYGHSSIWECSLEQLIEKVVPVLQDHQRRNLIPDRVLKTAAHFLRIKFDRKELAGEINYEVTCAIQEALIYYVNCLGEDV